MPDHIAPVVDSTRDGTACSPVRLVQAVVVAVGHQGLGLRKQLGAVWQRPVGPAVPEAPGFPPWKHLTLVQVE
jgi:hypothetical protein